MQEILRKFGFGIKPLIFGFGFVYQIWVRVWICSLDLGSSLDLVSTTWIRFGFGFGLGFVQILQIDLDLVINISVFLRVNLWFNITKSKPESKSLTPNPNHEITNPKALGLLHP